MPKPPLLKKVIDPWSVPHFLFGMVAALGALVFSWPLLEMFFVTLAIAILWEFAEMRMRLREAEWNVMSDVLLPLVAYGLTVGLVDQAGIDARHRESLLIVSLILYLFTNAYAWLARLERDREFMS